MKRMLPLLAFVMMTVAGCGGATITFQPVVSDGYYPPYYSGSTYYGWTPGHVARVCERRYTGVVCFDRWIPHQYPW